MMRSGSKPVGLQLERDVRSGTPTDQVGLGSDRWVEDAGRGAARERPADGGDAGQVVTLRSVEERAAPALLQQSAGDEVEASSRAIVHKQYGRH